MNPTSQPLHKKTGPRLVFDLRSMRENGHVLLAVLACIMILSLLGMTALFLASQDVPGVSATKEETSAQQLADAAAELVINWFHNPDAAPASLAGLLAKRLGDETSGPSFFDAVHRSQFIGTADHPDVFLDATHPVDNTILNGTSSGFPGSLRELGRLAKLKLYGPMLPGLLGTLEVTSSTEGHKPMRRTVQMQLGALTIPAVRAAVQIGKGLGILQPGGESPIRAHWGDQRIVGDLVIKRMEELAVKLPEAPVTGQPYEAQQAVDRWSDYWVGGALTVLFPPPGQGLHPIPPPNVHLQQLPSPGVRLDQWEYEAMKRTALRYGTYYRLDHQGQLHFQNASEDDHDGIAPSEVLTSQARGDHRGLVFIDTVDAQPPRADNQGTLVLDSDYLEIILIVQGHVVIKPHGTGQSVPALSPPPEGSNTMGLRIPVLLSGIHLSGLLWTTGRIYVERSMRIFGAVMAGDSVVVAGSGATMEVWYNSELAQGLFRGIPVVYRAPGTWRIL